MEVTVNGAPALSVTVAASAVAVAVDVTGPSARDKHHEHVQGVGSDEWSITHNLGKYPAVSVTDSLKREVIGEVEYLTANSLVIRFSAPFSGIAYCN